MLSKNVKRFEAPLTANGLRDMATAIEALDERWKPSFADASSAYGKVVLEYTEGEVPQVAP